MLVVNFASQSLPPDGRSHNNHDLRNLQYQTIGKTLLICEVSCWRVGIPWLIPTSRVRELSAEFEPPIEDFVRSSLVTVGTKALECYLDDLEHPEECTTADLGIEITSVLEKFSFPILLFSLFFGIDMLLNTAAGVSLSSSIITSIVIGACAAFCGTILSQDQYRSKTFYWVLSKELLRRRGLDNPNSKPVPIVPVAE